MNRYPIDKAAAAKLWNPLLVKWQAVEGDGQPDWENAWKKSCNLFTAYIVEAPSGGFRLEITSSDFKDVFFHMVLSEKLEDACLEADRILAELLMVGAETLGATTVPADEIRFKSITAMPDGKLVGLGTDGVVYFRSYPRMGGPMAWTPALMNVVGKPQEL